MHLGRLRVSAPLLAALSLRSWYRPGLHTGGWHARGSDLQNVRDVGVLLCSLLELSRSSQRLQHLRMHRWPLRSALAYSGALLALLALLAAGLACVALQPQSGAVQLLVLEG